MSALVKVDERAGLAAPQDQQQYLTFMLGGETFAIGILAIKEIIEYGNLTEVPMMPDYIRGVINLRGSVVPVVDLSTRFGRKSTQLTRRTCIVIIEVASDQETQVVGVVVDAVNEVLEIAQDQIEPPPAFGAKIRTDFIRGMGKVDGKFVIILNVGNVLSIDDLALLEQADAQGMGSANEAAAE
ncbi:MAG: chemotaxis protein CheW [Thiobacillus sp. 63-78]|uniref:chemotaxis protein CheW n=1 Tax=Thiobacillus sp. 63-78 TaxID=1895859 RepID=UPI00095CD658|nr:chemotaxis protein CheW [Thiobacillus sp. 63-78]MBN8763307.1 purine-binding chemotaxis protein CheW [Thiobacillus sp.]OJZ16339.1 MAG: chemotaxis protein CheW [Thiobacillus sp. 63-78]